MLIHQWVESYKEDSLKYRGAKALLIGCEFFDCGDPGEFDPTIAGEAIWQIVRPPFPNVVMQYSSEINGGITTSLVFVREHTADEFIVSIATKMPDGKWFSSGQCMWARLDSGFSLSDATCELFGDYSGSKLAIANMVSLAWSTFAVIGCSNIKSRDNQPSAALNKKRTKAGKMPLVAYKTLEIIVPNERVEGEFLGGTHSSPRVHLRRGHIRQFKNSHSPIWIQACVVGSAHGMIVKDYSLKHQQDS